MEKKYELTDITTTMKESDNKGGIIEVTLYRIRALKDFNDVKKGDLGGWVYSENNLSQEGNCWIYDDAKAFRNSKVTDNATIHNSSILYDNALLSEDAIVEEHVVIADDAKIYGKSKLHGILYVCGKSKIHGNAYVSGDITINGAEIYGKAYIDASGYIINNVKIYGQAKIIGTISAKDNVKIFDFAQLIGTIDISDNAEVYGIACISGDICLFNNAKVSKNEDVLIINSIKNITCNVIGTIEYDTISCFKGNNGEIYVYPGIVDYSEPGVTETDYTIESFKLMTEYLKNKGFNTNELEIVIKLIEHHFNIND